MAQAPKRPTPHADLTNLIDAAGGSMPSSRAEIAAATAAVVVEVSTKARRSGGLAAMTLV